MAGFGTNISSEHRMHVGKREDETGKGDLIQGGTPDVSGGSFRLGTQGSYKGVYREATWSVW